MCDLLQAQRLLCVFGIKEEIERLMVGLRGVKLIHQPREVVFLHIFTDTGKKDFRLDIDLVENIRTADAGQLEDLR